MPISSMPAMQTISPGPASFDLDALQAARSRTASDDLARLDLALPRDDRESRASRCHARGDAADGETADVVVVVEVVDQHLQRPLRSPRGRRRDVARGSRRRAASASRPGASATRVTRPAPCAGDRVDAPGSRSGARSRRGRCTASRRGRAPPCARASCRSILLMTSTVGRPMTSALESTNRVCGSGPSAASTSSSTPSTRRSARSTSPPKSAWPGVSMMLILMPASCTAVFLARMVMPFSRSRSFESMTRSAIGSFARKTPAWRSM